MKEALIDFLINAVGDGMVKIIYGAYGAGNEAFLFETLRSRLEREHPQAKIVDTRDLTSEEIKKECLSNTSENGRVFVLAKDLWDFADFDALVNLCARRKNIDLFAIAQTAFPVHSLEKQTLIRGRLETSHFPSTLYTDYLKKHPNSDAFGFLTCNDLDEDVVAKNLETLNRLETACLAAILRHDAKPLTECGLAKEISKKTKKPFSWYRSKAVIERIEGLGICYFIERWDIKQKRAISGKVVFPIDGRYYKIVARGKKKTDLCVASALIAKLLYDRWDVKKAIYESQRNRKTYCRDTDAGFLVKKNGWSFLLFPGESLADDLVEKARLAPSSLPKVIVSLDALGGVRYGDDGLIYYSLETLLKEGLRIYGEGNCL